MKLAKPVEVSRRIASTRSRKIKVAGLADLLSRAAPGEIEILVGFLSGRPRQGRIGIGGATLYAARTDPAESPSLTLSEVDHAIGRIPGIKGRGSRARRLELLEDLMGRATAEEQ